jgi:hypothetical protein
MRWILWSLETTIVSIKVIDISTSEMIVAVAPESCSGLGWANEPTFVYIYDSATGKYRSECIQPTERSSALHYLFHSGAAMCASLIAAVPTRLVDSAEFGGDDDPALHL